MPSPAPTNTPPPPQASGRPPLRLPSIQLPGRFGMPGFGQNSESQAQASARFQALHAEMYEDLFGEQAFSYNRAGTVCDRLAAEPISDLGAEVRAMLFGTVALRIFHDRSDEGYKVLGRRHTVERLIELLRSDLAGIVRVKMARTSTRTAWLLPATNFAKELAGLMTDAEQIPGVCTQLASLVAELKDETLARDFFRDAGRLASNMARSVLLGRTDLVQQLTAVFA
jgi:hypothetical protein